MSLIHNKPPDISKEIERQRKAEGARSGTITPIEHPVGLAKDHTPVYSMHRYFARRPWNVFEFLIKHYSHPGDVVYDPFCGGGVSVVEAMRLRRRAIGIDINPLAKFITRMEVLNIDLNQLEEAFGMVEKSIKSDILNLYRTSCPYPTIPNWRPLGRLIICVAFATEYVKMGI